MSAADALRALREEAYCRVVRCFLAGEYSMQKEAMLSRLRGELAIPPARHAALRDAVERGVDSPWLTGGGGGGGGGGAPSASGGARGGGGSRARAAAAAVVPFPLPTRCRGWTLCWATASSATGPSMAAGLTAC